MNDRAHGPWDDLGRSSGSPRQQLGRLGNTLHGALSLDWMSGGRGREPRLAVVIAAALGLWLIVSVGARDIMRAQPLPTASPSASAPAVVLLPTATPTQSQVAVLASATPTLARTATVPGLQVTRNATFTPGGSLPPYPFATSTPKAGPAVSGGDAGQATPRPQVPTRQVAGQPNAVAGIDSTPQPTRTAFATNTPTITVTPSPSFTPTVTRTPSPTALASAQMSFVPSDSVVGEKVDIWVSSSSPYINVKLEGPFDPRYIAAWQTPAGYTWRWEVTPRSAGRFLYQFTANDGHYLLAYAYLDVSAHPTPTATRTPTLTPTATKTPTSTGTPGISTATATATATATSTPTNTTVPVLEQQTTSTATPTSAQIAATATGTPTPTASPTVGSSPTAGLMAAPSATATP